MIVMLALGTAVTALAGGGVGTGGGDGGGGGGKESGGDRYDAEWDSFSAKDKKWAHKTSECEAGEDPNIHSPGKDYHGAFQFLKSTWQSGAVSKGKRPAQLLLEGPGSRRRQVDAQSGPGPVARLRPLISFR